MESLAGLARLEIEIDEWPAAQELVESVYVHITWRGARDDPALAGLLAGLPSSSVSVPGFSVGFSLSELVPIKLLDGRTELAPIAWKGLRFGRGLPIYKLARTDFGAWSGGNSFLEAARRSEIGRMVRRLVPDFDSYTDSQQADFLIRTQNKIDAVRQSAEDLANHLEYARPDKAKAVPPRKSPTLQVRAAVFSDMLKSTRRAGELLGVPQKDKTRYENQRVRQMAKLGRILLHEYYGRSEYEAIIVRMQRYHRWWKWFDSIEDPREQMYVLLAEAQGTSVKAEQLRAAEDGFADTLEEWVGVVKMRLEVSQTSRHSENLTESENAQQLANQLWRRQQAIEETDARFEKALSLASLEVPPPSIA
jgi:hypothetical protein